METYFNTVHVEVFEDGGKMTIEGCCTIIAVSINLTAARLRTCSHNAV